MRHSKFFTPVLGMLLGLVLTSAQATAQDTWDVDNSHTSIVFAVSHMGLSYTYGRFNECAGTIVLNDDAPGSSTFDFEISVDSIDTNQAARDEHLKGPDFFDAEQFPTINFKSLNVTKELVPYDEAGIQKIKTMYTAVGDMTMRGETRDFSIPLQLIAIGRGPQGKERCGFHSKFVVKRSDFGMDTMSNMIGDQIAVTFSFEAIKKVAEEAEAGGLGGSLPVGGFGKKDGADAGGSDNVFGEGSSEPKEPASPFDGLGDGDDN